MTKPQYEKTNHFGIIFGVLSIVSGAGALIFSIAFVPVLVLGPIGLLTGILACVYHAKKTGIIGILLSILSGVALIALINAFSGLSSSW